MCRFPFADRFRGCYFQRYDFHPNEKGEGDLSKEVGSTILEHIPEAARALDFIQQSIALLAGKFPVAMNLIPGGITNFRVDRVQPTYGQWGAVAARRYQ